nr:phosphatidylinositol 3,4,5-trisphosphate 3-phosphatase TPTE2-like [Chlorocebus sabaeus]
MEVMAADKSSEASGQKRMERMEHGLVPHTPELCQHMSPDPNALEGVIIERSPSDSPQTNELKGATEETLTNETPHSTECKGADLLSPVSKR